ncbi:MAG TPA: PAS domain-containing protein, partial [Candidatus Binataceae bacterium]|nr:PAS domain-containing protein [Candidatus Binataceae bacterium]
LAHWHNEAIIIIGFTLVGIVVVAALFVYVLASLRRNERLLAEISRSEEKFRALMAALPDSVLIIDEALQINFANAAAEKLYGYPPGAMNGLDLRDCMAPEARSDESEAIQKAFHNWDISIRLQGMERIASRHDGSTFPVEVNASAYDAPSGHMLVAVIRDVSKRQANDRALRRSRESLARAQRVAGVGSFDFDLATGEREWSEEFLRIWGFTEMPGENYLESLIRLVHPEDRAAFVEGRKTVLAGKTRVARNFRIIRPDGVERILHNEYSADFDADGKAVRLFGTIQDVTERQKIELELRNSRENLARAQRIACVGSFVRNLVTGEVEFSDELYRIHGVAKGGAQATLEYLHTLVHPDDLNRVIEFRRSAATGQPTPAIDYRIIRPDGEERVLHRECDLLFDESGKPVCLYGTLQDVTERKHIEIELRRSREFLARAQQIAAIGSFDHDLIAGKVEWSDQLYRLYGLNPETNGGSFELACSFVHADDREKFRSVDEQAKQRIGTAAVDFRIIRVDGSERILHRECNIHFDASGKPTRMFGTLQDITTQKEGELELRRNREALTRAQQIAAIGSFDRDLVTGKSDWSDEFRRIWGIDDGRPPGSAESLLPLVHPDDRAKFLETKKAAADDKPSTADFRIIRPDGEERVLHRTYGLIRDAAGKPVRSFGTVQDITERKKFETELRRSRENLARAQRLAGIGSFERDLVTGEGEWSDEFRRIWGLERLPEGRLHDTLEKLVHPEDRAKFNEARDAAMSNRPVPATDFRITRPDGQERIVHPEYRVVFDD